MNDIPVENSLHQRNDHLTGTDLHPKRNDVLTVKS
jgi:hypothetical protein